MAAKEFDASSAVGGGSHAPPTLVAARSRPGKIILHLGVIDQAYANAPIETNVPQAKKGKLNKPIKPKVKSGEQTTGDVAEWLEDKYHIMQTFADAKLDKIAANLEDALAGSLESMMMGAPPPGNPFAGGESKIEAMFKDFILTQEVEQMGILGVPTQAALDGVNHRLKHPYAKGNPRRPSFVDTSLFVQSFKCWVD